MTEGTAGQPDQQLVPIDLGQALSALLRRYLEGAQEVVVDLPGGPRGLQVMAVSAEGTCSNQATIAQRLGIDRTVMTYLVDDLEKAGLVERRPDPADRRARQVVVTPSGRHVLTDASSRMLEVERTVLGGLPDEEIDTFRRLLSRAVEGVPLDDSACSGPGVPSC